MEGSAAARYFVARWKGQAGSALEAGAMRRPKNHFTPEEESTLRDKPLDWLYFVRNISTRVRS
jgi:hypothetical protein